MQLPEAAIGYLLPLARRAVAQHIVKRRVVWLSIEALMNKILILLRGVVRDMIKIPGVGNAGGVHAVVQRAADLRAAAGLPAQISRRGGHMVLVVGQIVGGLQPTEGAQVVQLVVRAGHFQLFARGGKLPASPWKRIEGKLVVPCGVVRLTTPLPASAP